jgi:hypothetical protein
MPVMKRVLSSLAVWAVLLGSFRSARADQGTNKVISTTGAYAFGGLSLLLPLLQDGDQGLNHSARTLDSLAVSFGFAYGLKNITHVKRPNSNSRDSFPSEHSTAAFAIATMQAQFHPSEAPLWYLGAAVIGVSRVQLHEHHWSDVFAGAVLGFGTARLELSSHRGLLLYPIMNDDGGAGLELSIKF